MRQSDLRVPGRGGAGSAWAPRVDPVDEPDGADVKFPVLGGEPFTVVMPVQVVPDQEYLEALYQVVKDTVYAAVRDGTQEAVADMMSDADVTDGDEQQPAADGGLSPE